MTNKLINELPPFTPQLLDFRLAEFHAQSLELLKFPIHHDEAALDLAVFQIDPPTPPPDPQLPLLDHVWYPKPIEAVREWASGRLMPTRPEAFVGKVRNSQAQELMQPLLAGEGPTIARGELGMGKTTLLAYVATNERTTRRYRRVWWLDNPARVIQTLALALDIPQVLTLASSQEQIKALADALDDNTLLVMDNLSTEDVERFAGLTKHLLMAVETPPEAMTSEEDIVPDPDGIVTLRPLPRTDGLDMMAHFCGITDTKQMRGQMRSWLTHLAKLLGGNPLAMVITGALFREDNLPMEQLVEMMNARITPEDPRPNLAIDLSFDALPSDYADILYAFGALPPSGATLEALLTTAKIRNPLTGYRGLAFLTRRGFIQRDERPGERYIVHPLIWTRMAAQDMHAANNEFGERLRQWVLTMARRHSESADQIYRYQSEILHTLEMAKKHHLDDVVHKLNMTLGSYFREYAPDYLADDIPVPRLMGDRAHVAKLVKDSLDYLRTGIIPKAQEAIDEAMTLAEKHSSDHEIAEALVVSARVADAQGEYRKATKYMERAAKLAFDLNNEDSLHILRIGLAMLYRKQERYKDALGVLDEQPDTFAERARIFRAMEEWDQMLVALDKAGNLNAIEKAESYLLAGRYAEALEALQERRDSASDRLRAQIYHFQDDLDNAIRGYQQAIDAVSAESSDALDARLAMGTAFAAQSNFKEAEIHFTAVLDSQNRKDQPDFYLKGKALGLLAALNLIDSNPNQAIKLGEEAIKSLKQETARKTHRVLADVYRTLGRANWRLERYKQAVVAFEGEVDQAQSVPHRDEYRIGMALHHLADMYRHVNENERAIANYRRSLTHKDAQANPLSYYMTQMALHSVLFDAGRYTDALEISQAALKHLDSRPPADLQHLGYTLCIHSRTFERLDKMDDARRILGRWLSVLAGRSDAMTDTERPQLSLLALSLATRSLIASRRAEEAFSLAETALALAERSHPSTDIAWSSRRDLAEIHLLLEEWQRTIDTYAYIFHEDNKVNDFTYAFAQNQTALAHWNLGLLDEALHHYELAITRQPLAERQALIYEQMADIYLEKREPEKAIAVTQKAADLIDEMAFTGDAARIHTKLAQLFAGSNQFSEAVVVYEDALSMLRNLPDVDPIHMARVYTSLAESNEAQGQYPEAAIAYRNALDTLENTPALAADDHRAVLTKLAHVRVTMQQFDEAIILYQQARDETEHYGTELELGAVTAKLADLYRDTNQFEDALYYYEQALELQPAAEVSRERAATLRGYGRTLARVEQFEDARRAWNQALAITTDAPPLEIALTHRAIGQAYRAQQMFDEAKAALREALQFHEADSVELAETIRLLGATLVDAKEFSEAIQPLKIALVIEEGLPQQVNIRIVQTLDLLAYAQEMKGDISDAIAIYHKALVYMDKNHQPIPIANRLRTLGRLYTFQQRWKEAHKALEDVLEIEFDNQPRSDARIAQTLEMIAVAYRREGLLEKAADAYKRMASYSNLTKTASADLKATLDELERQQATLDAARQSLVVLERTGADIKDLLYVYALIAQTEANLANVDASNDAIDSLLTLIERNANLLDISDPRPEYRALAHLFEGSQCASVGKLGEARAHFQRAHHDTDDTSMQWVIQRGLDSVRE